MVTIQAHRQEQHAKANQLGAEEYNLYDDEDVKLHFTNDGVKFFAEIVLPLIQSYFKAHQHYYVTLLYALSVSQTSKIEFYSTNISRVLLCRARERASSLVIVEHFSVVDTVPPATMSTSLNHSARWYLKLDQSRNRKLKTYSARLR